MIAPDKFLYEKCKIIIIIKSLFNKR